MNEKICSRCGHEPCPYCKYWCDVLLYSEKDGHIDPKDKKKKMDWPVLCCGGECDYTSRPAKKRKTKLRKIHLK